MGRILLTAILILTSFSFTQCQTPRRETNNDNRNGQASPTQLRQEDASAYARMTLTNARGERMRYLLFIPDNYDKQKKYPLVLWLHGGGSRGDDLDLLLAWGNTHGFRYLARPENQSKYPSFIVAPQCPLNKHWGNPGSNQPTAEMRLALEILDKVQTDYNIDAGRLYVMGISLGGYGTWDIITRRPRVFAAAVPICGGGDPSQASLMVKTSIWVFHGDQDELVDVSESRSMVAALRKAGGAPKYTEYKGVGHNAWERAFSEPDLLSWLFAQRLSE